MNDTTRSNPNSQSFHIFHFNGQLDMRIELGQDDEPWFCAKDVCDILDIVNSRQAASELDEDERDTVATTDGVGRKKDMIFVSESGLYALIFNSRKPEAKRFRKWVTKEVLPAIRKMGYYGDLSQKEISAKERNSYIREIETLTERLINTKDAMLYEVRMNALQHFCRLANWPLPNLALISQDPKQLQLEWNES